MAVRIVIAEDEAIIRLDLRETLIEEGYEVVGEASCGDEAIALVRQLRPDLAILDIKMPGVDGVEATKVISSEALCPVILVTAFSQREIIENARDAGALAYIVKPFQKTDLVPAIEVALGRFRELKLLSAEVGALEEQLETRKVLDKAKGILMSQWQMTENDAYLFLQRAAMSERCKMRDVAERVISGEAIP
ncbi:MAG: response regulator [Actinomycetes bacterium]